MSTENSLATGSTQRSGVPPVALIAGPTASGKSDLAIRLALALEARGRRGVVINADSAQVYADLAVLSARPTADEMRGVDHRLFGTWDGATACSAADWAGAARRNIAEAHAAGAVPILVGGTGLYLRTLIDGIAPIPPIDPVVREAVRGLHVAEAHAALSREDPDRAALLHPSDTTRVARALEVVRSTGRPLGAWQAERSGGIAGSIDLHPVILLPDRPWLYERCDRRFAVMLTGGAIEEVRALMRRGLDPDLPVMRAIGVPEVRAFLAGEASLAATQERGSLATRHYVKRQLTWLRHQCPAEWPRAESEDFCPKGLFVRLLHD